MGIVLRVFLALSLLIVPACGADEPTAPPGIFFPTVPIGDAYPAALIEGVLEERSGCLYVAAHGERSLLLWPEGYTAQRTEGDIAIIDNHGKLVGPVGERVSLGGGQMSPTDVGADEAERWASGLTGLDIPERCGDLYWIISP